MSTPILLKTAMPDNPEPEVRIYPDASTWMTLRPAAVPSGADQLSVFRAKRAQQQERARLLLEDELRAADELHAGNMVDSVYAFRVANQLPQDLSEADRLNAASVAVRLYDPAWMTISRYRAAVQLRDTLRLELSRLGAYVAESDLRTLADKLAGQAQTARMKAWTGAEPVTVTEWSRCRYGLLTIQEDKE